MIKHYWIINTFLKRVKHTPHASHIKKEKSLPSAQSSFDRDDYPFYSLLAECNKDHIQHHLHRHQITITEPSSSSSSSSSSLSSIKRCLTGHIHYKAVFCSPYELSCYCLIYMLCTIDIHHIPPQCWSILAPNYSFSQWKEAPFFPTRVGPRVRVRRALLNMLTVVKVNPNIIPANFAPHFRQNGGFWL